MTESRERFSRAMALFDAANPKDPKDGAGQTSSFTP